MRRLQTFAVVLAALISPALSVEVNVLAVAINAFALRSGHTGDPSCGPNCAHDLTP